MAYMMMKKKYAKSTAGYKMARGSMACKNCKHFASRKNLCSIVSGYISPNATCKYFMRK